MRSAAQRFSAAEVLGPNHPLNNPLAPPTGPSTVAITGTSTISTRSRYGRAGQTTVTGDAISLNDTTRIDATGATGGGTVLVGGNWQGSADPLLAATDQPSLAATTVTMAAGATIDASATQQGNGGTVVLWSNVGNPDSTTVAQGRITARGGIDSGNGGQVETSGYSLNTDGIRVDAGANQGTGGLWLLDPADATISQTVANGYANTLNTGTNVTNDVAGNITWTSGVSLNKTSGGDATLTIRTNPTTAGISNNITLTNNGQVMQKFNTSDMAHHIPRIIEWVSSIHTLEPGDIITTGTPPGVGMGIKVDGKPAPVYLKRGDVMRLGIDGLGEQSQKVVAFKA